MSEIMWTVKGKGISGGIATGRIKVLRDRPAKPEFRRVADSGLELERYAAAVQLAEKQLDDLYGKAVAQAGEEAADIFKVHRMLLEDEDYTDAVIRAIREDCVTAQYAVSCACDTFSAMFLALEDEYMRARAADIEDISRRLIGILDPDTGTGGDNSSEPYILMARDLSPSQTVQLDKSRLLGFVIRDGSGTSHTAILARLMGIPALTGVEFDPGYDGKTAVLDADSGILYVEPDEETLDMASRRMEKARLHRKALEELKGKPAQTRSGKRVSLYANIGGIQDVDAVLENDAEGIGLFRSEFLYIGNPQLPSEDEQFEAYRTVAQRMKGREVIIRTLDIGADKQADCLDLPQEANPALGLRAIRLCLTRPEIFRTQLRAILRASAFGNVSVMFPMIISTEEVRQARALLEQARDELRTGGYAFKDIPVGIMIETPAAVELSGELAKEVDFFSIGTNDLTQYTLAMDRQNPQLEKMYNSRHPAILSMIRRTVENAHRHGCRVGICGELGSDPGLVRTFIEYGVDELSVSPSAILELREKVRSLE